jgi:shikimate dehydrogenase
VGQDFLPRFFRRPRAADEAMRLLGLLGHPVNHSLSPGLMNRFFRRAGMDAAYGAFSVAPQDLPGAVQSMRTLGFLGANVTIPHKEKAACLAERLSPEAKAIGAANVLRWNHAGLEGHNSDAYGFLRALKEAGFSIQEKGALVLGAGGAARAVIYALLSSGTGTVFLTGRRPERMRALLKAFHAQFPDREMKILSWGKEGIAKAMPEIEIIVNATPLGMGSLEGEAPPFPYELLSSSHLVADLVYNPRETRFLALAKRQGARTMNGLPMFLFQAAKSLELWFGENVEERVIPFWKDLLCRSGMN